MIWDGKRWHPDETLTVRDMARQICRETAAACNHAKTSKMIASAKTIGAVERLAQADRRIASTVDQWDADPWLLNTPEGTIDLKTGSIGKHDPGDCLTKVTGVAPGFDMPTPIWDAFLKRAMDGQRELVDYLQRVAGYSLTGSIQEHALFFNYGKGQRQVHFSGCDHRLRWRLSPGGSDRDIHRVNPRPASDRIGRAPRGSHGDGS